MYVCIHVCTCMYVCMYVCICMYDVCTYVHVSITGNISHHMMGIMQNGSMLYDKVLPTFIGSFLL